MRWESTVQSILIVGCLGTSAFAQMGTVKAEPAGPSCAGLHAGIRAQIVPPYTETPSVMLSLVLLNDAETPIDVEAETWNVVIDGRELPDSGMIFGNGIMPVGGYRTLKPGESYEFGVRLSIVEYFLPNGEHKVSWKGKGFHSSTVAVTISASSH